MEIVIFFIIGLFLILTILGILVINIYNKLIFYKKKVLDKFSDIKGYLYDDVDVIKKVISIIDVSKYHEDSLILKLNTLIDKILNENSVNGLLILIDDVNKCILEVMNLSKIYEELNNNSDFSSAMDKLNNNNYKIMYALEIYNEEVEEYNNYKNGKVNNIVFKIFKFENYNYYKK